MSAFSIVPGLAERTRVQGHTPTCECHACLGTLAQQRVMHATEAEENRPIEAPRP